MRILKDEEIKEKWLEGYKEQDLTSNEFDLDYLSDNLYFEDMHALQAIARAQHQLDLKDFIIALKSGHSVDYIMECLKQLADK